MSFRILEFGAGRVVMMNTIIEGAPAIVMVEGLEKEGEVTDAERAALTETGVALRFASYEGADNFIAVFAKAMGQLGECLEAAESGIEDAEVIEEIPAQQDDAA